MRRLLPSLILATCSTIPAHSQATPTASRNSDFIVFAEYQNLHTDYGPQVNKGLIAGLDYARYFRGPVVPSLELRANYASVQGAAGEQVALGGVRADIRVRTYPRLHPYVNFLVGAGQIDFYFAQPTTGAVYSRDNSIVFNYGAGASYGIGHGLELQAEYQHQNWNLSPGTHSTPLTPSSVDAGLRYHVHLPSLNRR